jgi:hypothetical protein
VSAADMQRLFPKRIRDVDPDRRPTGTGVHDEPQGLVPKRFGALVWRLRARWPRFRSKYLAEPPLTAERKKESKPRCNFAVRS